MAVVAELLCLEVHHSEAAAVMAYVEKWTERVFHGAPEISGHPFRHGIVELFHLAGGGVEFVGGEMVISHPYVVVARR